MNDYMTQPIKCNRYFRIRAKSGDYERSWMYCVLYQPNIERDAEEFVRGKLESFKRKVPYEYVEEGLEMSYEEIPMYYSEMVILD